MTTQCDRCKRETDGWPLKRADVCSPKHWARCIRQPRNVGKSRLDTERCPACGGEGAGACELVDCEG